MSNFYVGPIEAHKTNSEHIFGGWLRWGWLSTDGTIEELHEFAERFSGLISSKRFVNSQIIPLYTITEYMREQLILMGAIPIRRNLLIRICRIDNPKLNWMQRKYKEIIKKYLKFKFRNPIPHSNT